MSCLNILFAIFGTYLTNVYQVIAVFSLFGQTEKEHRSDLVICPHCLFVISKYTATKLIFFLNRTSKQCLGINEQKRRIGPRKKHLRDKSCNFMEYGSTINKNFRVQLGNRKKYEFIFNNKIQVLSARNLWKKINHLISSSSFSEVLKGRKHVIY